VITSACTLDCPDACSLLVQSSSDGLRVRGNPEHPITRGFACGKIRRHARRLASPSRVTAPWLKTEKGWRSISWNEALEMLASSLQPLLERQPQSVLHIQGHGSRGISKDVCDGFFSALGCSKTFGSLCDGTGIAASLLDFGALDHNDIRDLENAQRIVNWGRDLSRSSVHVAALINRARKRGADVISLCPAADGFEAFSDRIIRVAPGRDRFLALAVIKVLLAENWLAADDVARCHDSREFLKLLQGFSLEDLCRKCDVEPAVASDLAAVYARPPVASLIGWGLQRTVYGSENVRAINALAWLSGSVGSKGGGVYFNVSSKRHFDFSWLPEKAGRRLRLPDLADQIRKAVDPPLSMAWIAGSNPVNQAPDSEALAAALDALDFVVVADAFMTDTAACADLILPSTLMWEEEEVVGSCMHDFLQYTPVVVDPPQKVKSDLWMVRELNGLLGSPVALPDRKACFERSLTTHGGASCLQELIRTGFYQARNQPVCFLQWTAHPDGRFRLLTEVHAEPDPDPDYPLRLLSLVRRSSTHSQILPEDHGRLPQLWANPESAAVRGLQEQSSVWLVSELGRMEVELCFDRSLHPEAVVCRRGDWRRLGGGVNRLIQARLTDLGDGAAYYSQRVRLEKR